MNAAFLIARQGSAAYGWMMLAGIFVSIVFWSRLARRDERLVMIYIAALVSAFIGAKLVYLAAEGWLYWHDPNRWIILATGKSIIGALLGGYLGVEIAKRLLHYDGVTGDWFAVIVPIGIMLGRVGCMINGCCLGRECEAHWFTIDDPAGVPRWPASQVEFVFNAVVLAVILVLRWKRIASGQLFHIYLMAYGLFRFFHEFVRNTPHVVGPFSGYQFAALAVAALGMTGFVRRRFVRRETPVTETV
jgi:phosphatidylglycerol---prolipoprotein diacylglyceryl transferase